MTDSERKGVWVILNAISTFVAGINNRMGYVVFPEEQREMQGKIQKTLENMDFFKDIEVKDNEWYWNYAKVLFSPLLRS